METSFGGAFQDPHKEELISLFQRLKIHELAIEDIEHGNQISKIEEYDDHLFVVLKQMSINNNDIDIGDFYIVASYQFIITIRKGFGSGFTHVRKIVEKKSTNINLGTGFIMYSILDTVIDRGLFHIVM
jgi:magnesium transporter